MNVLLKEVAQSLIELEMGLKGELTFSATMERLMEDLRMNRIPAVWSKVRIMTQKIYTPHVISPVSFKDDDYSRHGPFCVVNGFQFL